MTLLMSKIIAKKRIVIRIKRKIRTRLYKSIIGDNDNDNDNVFIEVVMIK